jgi:hypothetical protein
MKTLLTPIESPRKNKTEICIEADSSKEKVKMGLFGYDSILELNIEACTTLPAFYLLLI